MTLNIRGKHFTDVTFHRKNKIFQISNRHSTKKTKFTVYINEKSTAETK